MYIYPHRNGENIPFFSLKSLKNFARCPHFSNPILSQLDLVIRHILPHSPPPLALEQNRNKSLDRIKPARHAYDHLNRRNSMAEPALATDGEALPGGRPR